jgi:hypothetical protein
VAQADRPIPRGPGDDGVALLVIQGEKGRTGELETGAGIRWLPRPQSLVLAQPNAVDLHRILYVGDFGPARENWQGLLRFEEDWRSRAAPWLRKASCRHAPMAALARSSAAWVTSRFDFWMLICRAAGIRFHVSLLWQSLRPRRDVKGA